MISHCNITAVYPILWLYLKPSMQKWKCYVKASQELVKVMTKSTKERNDERMNSAFVLQCALFFVINRQRRYSRVSMQE